MKAWKDILHKAITQGVDRPDRTGVGTLALFGEQLTFDNSGAFPAVTAKALAFRQVAAELACFVRGYDSLENFHLMGCRIWDGNAEQTSGSRFKPKFEGDLGRIYGVQWRDWQSPGGYWPGGEVRQPVHKDQLVGLVNSLNNDSFGRRHLVTAWNPGELDDVCLPPCHVMFQCFCRPADTALPGIVMDMRVDMRSVDLFLGLPFDVASYALLQRLICKETGLRPGKLVFQLGDAHVYKNHATQVGTVLARAVLPPPVIRINEEATLFTFTPDDVALVDYRSHPAVPAPLNV